MLFPIVFGILVVRVKPQDEDLTAVVMNGGNQPEVVSGDVEARHGTSALDSDKIGGLPGFTDVLRGFPIGSFGDPAPALEAGFGQRVKCGVLPKS